MNRRNLMKLFGGLGLWSTPMSQIFASVVRDQSLLAETKSRRYIGIQQPGAPSRWTFDLFLNPFNEAGLDLNVAVANRYIAENGIYTKPSYEFYKHGDLYLPYLWQFPIPKSDGSQRSMTELLDSLILMQGMTTKNPGHAASQSKHFQSVGAITTLPALAADHQDLPISALNLGVVNYEFKSMRGRSSVGVNFGGNVLEKILEPFNSRIDQEIKAYRRELKSSLEKARLALNELAKSENPEIQSIIRDKQEAEKLIERGFDGLTETWSQLYQKYFSLITRSITSESAIPGLTDKPIGIAVADRDARYQRNNNIAQEEDLRALIAPGTKSEAMIQSFAVAEYLMTNELSGTINVRVQPFSGTANVNFDEHQSGVMITTLVNSMYNRSLASCLLELIDRLKAKDMFRGTIIELSGEFNRNPKVNGFGSDHGHRGKSIAIYSGDIQGPHVIGNLRYDNGKNYLGHWGMGAPVAEVGEQINMAHWAASSARMLGVSSPVTSANSVIQEVNGILEPAIPQTKLIPKS